MVYPTSIKNCENKDEHMFHSHDGVVSVECSGKLTCGAWAHAPHRFEVEMEFWCEGVCNCGMLSRGPHGPGEHK